MTSIFIQPACRLALRSGTRAFSLSRNRLGLLTEGHAAKSNADLVISKEILQKRMDYGILQLEAKAVRRSIDKARMDRFRVRRMMFTEMLWRHMAWVLFTLWATAFVSYFSFLFHMSRRIKKSYSW